MILLFNNWFDLFNTQQKFDAGVPSYGKNDQQQNKLLDEMTSFVQEMRVHGKKSLLPFQKGFNLYLYYIIILF